MDEATLTSDEVPPGFSPQWEAAWRFADALARDALEASVYHELLRHLKPAEVAEIVALCAQQFGGVRMTDSIGAHLYPRTLPVQQEAIPVRLPYFHDWEHENQQPVARATRQYNQTPVQDIFARADRTGSPPRLWLELLAPNVPVLQNWTNFYWQVCEDGILPTRITQLIRIYMAEQLGASDWAPRDSPLARSISDAERLAVTASRFGTLAPAETAALAYAQEILAASSVSDETFASVSDNFSPAEIIELVYAVAVQNGVIRVFRSLHDFQLPTDWLA